MGKRGIFVWWGCIISSCLSLPPPALLPPCMKSSKLERWCHFRNTFLISQLGYSIKSVIFAILTLLMPKGISQINLNPCQMAQALGRTHANRHKLSIRTHTKWHEFRESRPYRHEFCSDSDHLLIRKGEAGRRKQRTVHTVRRQT